MINGTTIKLKTGPDKDWDGLTQ